jgi:outer membrane protein assembly factor BamD (BamD/ComL family)
MKARDSSIAAALGAALILASALLLSSCASAPKEIPAGIPAQTLVQRAQEASDKYDYEVAIAYYTALKERFGGDPAYLCAADYEIAVIARKQGRLGEARAQLEALLASFSQPGAEALPQRYRILAAKVLEKIDEEQKLKK